MSHKRTLQTLPPSGQQAQGALDVPSCAVDLSGPWLTTREAAIYLRYTGKHALRSVYRFLKAKRIPVAYRSERAILIAKVDLDRALKLPVSLRKAS